MRLIDADRLKGILEYGILCNVPTDDVNTEEEKWNNWVQEVVNKAPTVKAIPKADYEARLKADIADKSVDEGYLYDWYISSVTDDEPKWTEAHLKELVNDFYLIPKQESKNATD